MKYCLPEKAESDIKAFAEKHGIKKVILFGSRARGSNRERSDIDIAVSGGNIAEFALDVDEKAETLLMFDIVNLDKAKNKELLNEIKRDGVVIYEKTG
ncbi:MAG: nucleotidyltransferase family protein [Candidatus Ornithomonoglobus sp.]